MRVCFLFFQGGSLALVSSENSSLRFPLGKRCAAAETMTPVLIDEANCSVSFLFIYLFLFLRERFCILRALRFAPCALNFSTRQSAPSPKFEIRDCFRKSRYRPSFGKYPIRHISREADTAGCADDSCPRRAAARLPCRGQLRD